MCLLSGPQQPSRNEREAAGDAAVIALSRFHAHFREAAVTESSQPLPVDEVGTLFTNSHVRHWLYHQILCVSTYILSGKLNFSSCKVFSPLVIHIYAYVNTCKMFKWFETVHKRFPQHAIFSL